mmetsp:Transcript_177708/g.569699  ORF Transcript_177708/g.569699 Transcript_177708/m.569699 type:complete len:202 (+) Transcript_177708:834-1439(+)
MRLAGQKCTTFSFYPLPRADQRLQLGSSSHCNRPKYVADRLRSKALPTSTRGFVNQLLKCHGCHLPVLIYGPGTSQWGERPHGSRELLCSELASNTCGLARERCHRRLRVPAVNRHRREGPEHVDDVLRHHRGHPRCQHFGSGRRDRIDAFGEACRRPHVLRPLLRREHTQVADIRAEPGRCFAKPRGCAAANLATLRRLS